jgi:hypothetical protein
MSELMFAQHESYAELADESAETSAENATGAASKAH